MCLWKPAEFNRNMICKWGFPYQKRWDPGRLKRFNLGVNPVVGPTLLAQRRGKHHRMNTRDYEWFFDMLAMANPAQIDGGKS